MRISDWSSDVCSSDLCDTADFQRKPCPVTRAGGDRADRQRASIWLAAALITAVGIFAAMQLPVSLFPYISYPRVVVSIDAGERDPAEMAAGITRPVDIGLRAIDRKSTRLNSSH